jgi:two-component system NtrC family response regulator
VVVITGYATIASAVETMRAGAFDYLPKPFTSDELVGVFERALERRRLMQTASKEFEYTEESGFAGLIGRSRKMQEVYRLIRKVAPTESTVLIVGESGTGKDLVAKAIHGESPRKAEKFIAIDLTTLSSSLLESELFGHMKGAFTGAGTDKPGLFDVAHHGTVFLDEIGNLPLETQSRLLRILQEKEFIPVGGTSVRKVDIRLIFATNKNLRKLVERGLFREDLYYRLNVFPLRLPALRERPEDISELAAHFLKKYCSTNGRELPVIEPEAMQALADYHWPGNVRELEHVIERLTILVEGNTIAPLHISASLFHAGSSAGSVLPRSNEELKSLKRRIRESSVREVEKAFVEEALERNGWNVSRAARDVEMQRANFQALMKKHGIKRREQGA